MYRYSYADRVVMMPIAAMRLLVTGYARARASGGKVVHRKLG